MELYLGVLMIGRRRRPMVTPATTSIYEIYDQIHDGLYRIPEFQRDFVWNLERCKVLFDSLITGVFIGNIVLGPPEFGITTREFDIRPRSGRGSGRQLETPFVSHQDFLDAKDAGYPMMLVLDGQQRLTSMYRALLGVDELFFIAQDIEGDPHRDLDGWFDEISIQPDPARISIKLSDVHSVRSLYGEEKTNAIAEFISHNTMYENAADDEARATIRRIGSQIVALLEQFFNDNRVCTQTKIETNLDMFVKYFERSNSTAFNLSFVDILVAKIFVEYRLRPQLESVKRECRRLNIKYNNAVDENLVRMVAHLSNIPLAKNDMLNGLTGEHFSAHFETAKSCFFGVISWLRSKNLIFATTDIPYPNMIVPLMAFLARVHNHDIANIVQNQSHNLIEWFFRCGFTERYSKKAGEVLRHDIFALSSLGVNPEHMLFDEAAYRLTFTPSRIQSADDLLQFSSTSGSIPKSMANLIRYHADGVYSLRDNARINHTEKIDKHHIFPKQFIIDNAGDLDLINSLMNFVSISRTTNIQISARSPHDYFGELLADNPDLDSTLTRLLIPSEIIHLNDVAQFEIFLSNRAYVVWEHLLEYVAFVD